MLGFFEIQTRYLNTEYIYIYTHMAIWQPTGSTIEVEIIHSGKFEGNPRTPSQHIAYILYNDEKKKLQIQTPEFLT